MATSDVLSIPRLTRTTITLPRNEMSYALDPARFVQLVSMDVDGGDPSGPHLPASDFVYIWMEITGPYKVREVKDLEQVTQLGMLTIPQLAGVKAWRAAAESGMVRGTEHEESETPATPKASAESEICSKHCTSHRSCFIATMNAQFKSPEESTSRQNAVLQENLGSKSCGRHLKKHFAPTFRSKHSLPTDSSKFAVTRAEVPGFEMVEEVDGVEEEAKELVIFDDAEGMKEDYVDILKL